MNRRKLIDDLKTSLDKLGTSIRAARRDGERKSAEALGRVEEHLEEVRSSVDKLVAQGEEAGGDFWEGLKERWSRLEKELESQGLEGSDLAQRAHETMSCMHDLHRAEVGKEGRGEV